MERLARQVQEAQRLLSQPGAEWSDCSSAIEEVATAVELLGREDSTAEAMRHVMSISYEIGAQIANIRSRLVKDVCAHLVRIVKVVERDFSDLANALLPQVARTAKNASAAIRLPGSTLLGKISELARYDVGLLRKIFLESPQDRVRVLLLDQLRIIFIYWSDDEMSRYDAAILGMMTAAVNDHSPTVRKAARDVLFCFSSRWSHRIDELVVLPSSQARVLFVSEHQDSALSVALLEKYPELASKSGARSCSKDELAKKRSTFQKSPQHREEQPIEVHVPTPRSLKRRQKTTQRAEELAEGATVRHEALITVRSIQEEPLLSRQLFQDVDRSEFVDDDQLVENIPPAFDGSQMHRYDPRTSQAKRESTTAGDAELAERKAAIPSGIRSPRSKADLGRDSDAKRAQESRIPGPSMLNPPLRSRDPPVPKAAASTVVAADRFGTEETGIPRPRGFSGQMQGNDDSAMPDSGDKVDVENDGRSFDDRDDFFSRPIPSSTSMASRSSPSTDNVTMRPRRRLVANQEVEDSQARAESVLPSPVAPELRDSQDFCDEPPARSLQFGLPERRTGLDVGQTDEGRNTFCKAHSGENDMKNEDDQPSFDRNWSFRADGEEQRWHEGERMFEYPGNGEHEFDSETAYERETELQTGLDDGFNLRGETDGASPVGMPYGSEFPSQAASSIRGVSDANFAPHSQRDERAALDERPRTDSLPSQHDDDTEEEFAEVPQASNPPKDLPKDALNSLQEVRERVVRLRAQTMSAKTGHGTPLQDRIGPRLPSKTPTFTVPPIAEDPQQQSSEVRGEGMRSEPRATQPSYLERLRDADIRRFQPQGRHVVLREDNTRDDFETSEPASHTPLFPGLDEAPDYADVSGDGDQQRETADFTRDYACETIPGVHEEAKATYPSESAQRERFHAQGPVAIETAATHLGDNGAGGSALAKDVAGQDDRSRRPRGRSRSREAGMQEGARVQRVPPTRMGPKLNAMFASAREKTAVDSVGQKIASDAATRADSPTSIAEESAPESDDSPDQEEEEPAIAKRSDDHESTDEPTRVLQPPSTPSADATDNTRGPRTSDWPSSFGVYLVVALAVLFGVTGILRAAVKMRESHEYHLALKLRVATFEASIADSRDKVHELKENYAVWSEYVRSLAEEDEANALTHLEAIQGEVAKWQLDMKSDLVEFRLALSADSLEAALAPLRDENRSLDAED